MIEYFTTKKYEVVVVSRYCRTDLQSKCKCDKTETSERHTKFVTSFERYETRPSFITWNKSGKWVDKKLILFPLNHWQFTSDLGNDLIAWEKRYFILYSLAIFDYLSFLYLKKKSTELRLGLWCLTSLSAIFQLYCGSQFIGGGNWSTRRKPPTATSHS